MNRQIRLDSTSISTSRTTEVSEPLPLPVNTTAYILTVSSLGRTRWDRLFLIGRTSARLCVDALKAAVAEAKRGKDIDRYVQAVEHLRTVLPTDQDAVLDKSWIERTGQANRAETQRLDAELKGYKNNLIKESIRVSCWCCRLMCL